MPLTVTQQDRHAFVGVQEELTIYVVNAYRDTLSPLLADLDALHIDLSQVSELDSAGLQWLMALKQLQPRIRVSFERHSQAVTEVLDLLDLVAGFDDPLLLTAKAGGTSGAKAGAKS
jgi:anti-sigma B factor antagonist